jgi:ribosomal protein L40E
MVSNEEIKRMLENRRRGVKPEAKKESPSPVPPATGTKAMSPPTQNCESCGAQNPRDAKFCIKCGQTLKATEKVEEKKVKPAPADSLPRSGMDGIDYKTCPNCSHQNKPQAKFCVVCGHKLEDEPDSEAGTGSLLDRVSAKAPEDDQVAEEGLPSKEAPAVAELVDEESAQEKAEKRSLLSRKVSEETIREEPAEEVAEEAAVEEIKSEEVPAGSVSEEVPAGELVPEKAPLSEVQEAPEDELPQVKTFQLGKRSMDTGEEPAAEEAVEEEAGESLESASSEVDPMEKIKKAKELLDIGAISEEEFEKIKEKYLALI